MPVVAKTVCMACVYDHALILFSEVSTNNGSRAGSKDPVWLVLTLKTRFWLGKPSRV